MKDYAKEVDNRTLREKVEGKYPFRRKLIRKILRKKGSDCEYPKTCK